MIELFHSFLAKSPFEINWPLAFYYRKFHLFVAGQIWFHFSLKQKQIQNYNNGRLLLSTWNQFKSNLLKLKKYLTTALSTSTTAAAVTTTEKTKDQSIYHLYSVLQKFPGKKSDWEKRLPYLEKGREGVLKVR